MDHKNSNNKDNDMTRTKITADEYEKEIAEIARDVTIEAWEQKKDAEELLTARVNDHPWVTCPHLAAQVIRHSTGKVCEEEEEEECVAKASAGMRYDVDAHPDYQPKFQPEATYEDRGDHFRVITDDILSTAVLISFCGESVDIDEDEEGLSDEYFAPSCGYYTPPCDPDDPEEVAEFLAEFAAKGFDLLKADQ